MMPSAPQRTVHPWLKKLKVAFVPGETSSLMEQVVDGLLDQFGSLGHEVQESPQGRTDLVLTTARFGEPLPWRKALFFTARKRFGLENNPAMRIVAQATSTKFTRAMVYGNFEIDYVAPTAYTGRGKSNVTISSATIATTATLPFRLIDLWSSVAATGQPGADDSDYNWGIFEFNSAQSTGIV